MLILFVSFSLLWGPCFNSGARPDTDWCHLWYKRWAMISKMMIHCNSLELFLWFGQTPLLRRFACWYHNLDWNLQVWFKILKMNFSHTRKQSPVCFLKNGNLLMVFKGELFFLDSEASSWISSVFAKKKIKFWAMIDYC